MTEQNPHCRELPHKKVVMTTHINGYYDVISAPCMYTVTGWGAMCLWYSILQFGSTFVKIPLLQAGTVVI